MANLSLLIYNQEKMKQLQKDSNFDKRGTLETTLAGNTPPFFIKPKANPGAPVIKPKVMVE